MRRRRPHREEFAREPLARERPRLQRNRLRVGGHFPRQVAPGELPVLDREQRRSRLAIEHEHEPVLRRLHDSIDTAAVLFERDEIRRRRQVAIPEIVADELKMPQALPRRGVERDEAVREQVVADSIAAVEIRRGRTGRHEDDAGRFVERHARPAVRAAVIGPGVLRPRAVAGFAGMRNRVERPPQRARPRIVGADVAGRRRQSLADAAADDQQIAVHDAGRRQADRLALGRAPEIAAQIDPSVVAEARHRTAGPGVERVQVFVGGREDPFVVTVFPVHDAAVGTAPRQP